MRLRLAIRCPICRRSPQVQLLASEKERYAKEPPDTPVMVWKCCGESRTITAGDIQQAKEAA